MAVAGSTRLQATTVLMLAAGSALFSALDPVMTPRQRIEDFRARLEKADYEKLAELIRDEANIYACGSLCVHCVSDYAITVLTDTTERAPTFSLVPFENIRDPKPPHAWTYLIEPEAADALDSWRRILHREPRALEWVGIRERFGHDALQGFDFSPSSAFRRKGLVGKENVHTFSIERADDLIVLRLGDAEVALDRPDTLLNDHLILKCAMNISSTLMMGRLGRFRGNLMLYVRAANNKLIDRSIRFVRILLAESKISRTFTYEEVCYALFEVLETLPPDQPVVIKTFDKLMASAAGEVRRASNV
jgi:N-acetylmuramic acid 6-phosphate etherase